MKTCMKTEGGTMAISQHVLAQLMINDAHLGFGAENQDMLICPLRQDLPPAPRAKDQGQRQGQCPAADQVLR